MVQPGTYTAKDVAARLGHHDEWFSDHRPQLERDFNFPKPIPLPGRPRWSRAQVDTWIRLNGEVPAEPDRIVEDGEDGDSLPPDWTKKLLARLHEGEGV